MMPAPSGFLVGFGSEALILLGLASSDLVQEGVLGLWKDTHSTLSCCRGHSSGQQALAVPGRVQNSARWGFFSPCQCSSLPSSTPNYYLEASPVLNRKLRLWYAKTVVQLLLPTPSSASAGPEGSGRG